MIKSVDIRGYQSHKNTRVEFCPGTNVIVGLSDDGKSAVFRSIYWVVNNRPLGDGFINRDTKRTSVTICGDTYTVERSKGKGENSYTVNDATLTAFGSDPPPQVSEVVNLSSINFQRQWEPYFLVFDPPGQVATFVRSITKLDEIDGVIERIQRRRRSNKAEIDACKSELSDVSHKLTILSSIGLDRVEELINIATIVMKENNGLTMRISRLKSLVNQINFIPTINLPDDTNERLSELNKAIPAASNLRSRLDRLSTIVKDLKSIPENPIPDGIDEMLTRKSEAVESHDRVMGKLDLLIELVDTVDTVSRSIHNLVELENTELMESKRLKDQLTNCPTCGYKLDEERKVRVCQIK